MHDYKIATLPFTSERMQEAPKTPKTRKVLSPAERELVIEAVKAGGSRAAIAKRFDIAEQTVGNIVRDVRREKLADHVEAQPMVFAEPLPPKPKHITDAVSEVYRSIETLNEDDKLRVLLSVGYLYGFTPGLS